MTMRRMVGWILIGLGLAAWCYFVWPTPWAYYTPSGTGASGGAQHGGSTLPWLVRRNRFTGELQWASFGSAWTSADR